MVIDVEKFDIIAQLANAYSVEDTVLAFASVAEITKVSEDFKRFLALASADESEKRKLGYLLLAAFELIPIENGAHQEPYDWILCKTNGGLTIHAQVGNNKDENFANTPAAALAAAALKALETHK